jgi:hypothetical protein
MGQSRSGLTIKIHAIADTGTHHFDPGPKSTQAGAGGT